MVRGQQILGVSREVVLDLRVTVGTAHQQPEIYSILMPVVHRLSILMDKHRLYQQTSIAFGASSTNWTFNLPNYIGRTFWGGTSIKTLAAGLPSITHTHFGTIKTIDGWGGYNLAAGSNVAGTKAQSFSVGNNTAVSSIYGRSSTVQPPAIQTPICIKY